MRCRLGFAAVESAGSIRRDRVRRVLERAGLWRRTSCCEARAAGRPARLAGLFSAVAFDDRFRRCDGRFFAAKMRFQASVLGGVGEFPVDAFRDHVRAHVPLMSSMSSPRKLATLGTLLVLILAALGGVVWMLCSPGAPAVDEVQQEREQARRGPARRIEGQFAGRAGEPRFSRGRAAAFGVGDAWASVSRSVPETG